MTIDRLHLQELLEKGSDVDLLREMMAVVVNRMMDLDVESLTGAAYGERSVVRTNQRNGYRERPWHTTIGTLPVAIPKLRKGSYFPSFLEARRTSDKALIAVPPSGQKPSRLPDDPSRCRSDHGLCSYTTGWGTTSGELFGVEPVSGVLGRVLADGQRARQRLRLKVVAKARHIARGCRLRVAAPGAFRRFAARRPCFSSARRDASCRPRPAMPDAAKRPGEANMSCNLAVTRRP
jgi:hypothetical protein